MKVEYEIHTEDKEGDNILIFKEKYETNSTIEIETMLISAIADDYKGEIKLLLMEYVI
jgi:hypothetical protein